MAKITLDRHNELTDLIASWCEEEGIHEIFWVISDMLAMKSHQYSCEATGGKTYDERSDAFIWYLIYERAHKEMVKAARRFDKRSIARDVSGREPLTLRRRSKLTEVARS